MIYTFWEGEMWDYIRLCLNTWKVPFTILNYDNLGNYTDFDAKSPNLHHFTLPQIADAIRVHVLRDQGGYWLDADTIMVNGNLPTTNMVGNSLDRSNTIGYLHFEKNDPMITEWALYQDDIINKGNKYLTHWSVLGNDFTDDYVKNHPEITIAPVKDYWPETYMVNDVVPRHEKYVRFYFNSTYTLDDINPTDMLMLHNSWTPDWYLHQTTSQILYENNSTLSNILKRLVN